MLRSPTTTIPPCHSALPPLPPTLLALVLALVTLFNVAWVSIHVCLLSTAHDRGTLEALPTTWLQAHTHEFVHIVNGTFMVGGRRFPVAGWNQWEVVEMGAGVPALYGGSLPAHTASPALLRTILDTAASAGLTVMRAWAHGVQPETPMQRVPGDYNKELLRGLDYAMDEARKRGIRVLLSLTDNWMYNGGADQYTEWAGYHALIDHSFFFIDPTIKALYKQHVHFMLTRVNMVNGVQYMDDPTVFAWGLINEPRCTQCSPGIISAWASEMASFIKSIDPKHLVTLGSEGFYHADHQLQDINPGEWASYEGQHFITDHASPHIDFASIHLWPSNWQAHDQDAFVHAWLTQHMKDAAALGKPLLLEEFGSFPGPQRAALYRTVFDAVRTSVAAHGSLQGALFWKLYVDGQEAPLDEGGGVGVFAVKPGDAVWDLVVGFASDMQVAAGGGVRMGGGGAVGGSVQDMTMAMVTDGGEEGRGMVGEGAQGEALCTPGFTHRIVPTTTTHKAHHDLRTTLPKSGGGGRGGGGISPPRAFPQNHRTTGVFSQGGFQLQTCPVGFEGPNCTTDVNECVRGLAVCAAGEVCVNTYASGCAPHYLPAVVQPLFDTNGPGQLSCDEGFDLPYPHTAPGFQYAPVKYGEDDTAVQVGSTARVTLHECLAACLMAPACTDVSYNEVLGSCFLKHGSSRNMCMSPPSHCSTASHSYAVSPTNNEQQYDCGRWQSYFLRAQPKRGSHRRSGGHGMVVS